ncbi:MAG: OmpA family protein [Bacteroidales bacterium]|nr:OmpA family protein [Bacteroidales bacterium]
MYISKPAITKPKYIIFLIIFIIPLLIYGQGDNHNLSTSSKKAKNAYIKGEEFYRVRNIKEAEKYFIKATEEDPEFFEAYMLLADLYEQTEKYEEAIKVYNKAIGTNPDIFPGVYYLTANIEFSQAKYNDALMHYKKFLDYEHINDDNARSAQKNIKNCEFAIEAMKNPVPFDPINLDSNINTSFNEYFPCITADNQTLLFTRLIPDKNSYSGKQEDFYMSNKVNGKWEKAINIGKPINTVFNEGAPSLSADGNILIFAACESVGGYGGGRNGYGRCDLFFSKRTGDNWTNPRNMGTPINTSNWESQPSYSSDGKTLYFVSNQGGGYNIWKTYVGNDGYWTEPEKLEYPINTNDSEGSVFIHPDNQTLYFSSDGHAGMGGMDIFISRLDSTGNWGVPVNLGYPINTQNDESGFMVGPDGKKAYFSSDREGGFGGLDMYFFELYEQVRPKKVNYMKGIVFNSNTKEKLEAKFELIDLQTGEVCVKSRSNAGNGEFLVCLPAGRNYALNVSKDGFLFYSENFTLTGENPQTDPYLKDVPLQPIKVGESVVLKNIFFETDKYSLKEESEIELQKLIDLLNKNPEIKIEISGHTDNISNEEYNKKLSHKRAKSVYDYLIENGISKERLTFLGYGFSKPIDTNETEEGRANNRRTEFKVFEI